MILSSYGYTALMTKENVMDYESDDNVIPMKHFAPELRTMTSEEWGRELIITYLVRQGLSTVSAKRQSEDFSSSEMEALSEGAIFFIGEYLKRIRVKDFDNLED